MIPCICMSFAIVYFVLYLTPAQISVADPEVGRMLRRKEFLFTASYDLDLSPIKKRRKEITLKSSGVHAPSIHSWKKTCITPNVNILQARSSLSPSIMESTRRQKYEGKSSRKQKPTDSTWASFSDHKSVCTTFGCFTSNYVVHCPYA